MRNLFCLSLLLVALTLSGCVSQGAILGSGDQTPEKPTASSTATATRTQEPPSATAVPLTFTSTPPPTPTATATPRPTLNPEQAKETIRTLLQEPVDCRAPCFWGITPGETTLEEATNIFAQLGLQLQLTNARDGKAFYEVIYGLEEGLTVSPLLTVQDEIVKNFRVYITPEKSQPGVPRAWSAYSPETLIARYGVPSRVEFSLGRGEPGITFAMDIFFDAVDLIVEYGGTDLFIPMTSLIVCPPTARFDLVRLWLGKNPEHPPGHGVPLEEATSLTLEEFAERMTGDPESACLELKDDAFPP